MLIVTDERHLKFASVLKKFTSSNLDSQKSWVAWVSLIVLTNDMLNLTITTIVKTGTDIRRLTVNKTQPAYHATQLIAT